jgi:hypothetical protein
MWHGISRQIATFLYLNLMELYQIVSFQGQGNVTSELHHMCGQLERIIKTDILWATISSSTKQQAHLI